MWTQDEINSEQPDNMPFCVIHDDGESFALTFFETLVEAEEYNNAAPLDARVYCGRGVDFSLYS